MKTMHDSLSARWTGFLFLGVTSIGWAVNWAAIKILLREWPPLFSRGISGVAAGIILAGVAVGFGESLRIPRRGIVPLLFAAFTNVFAWMGFSTMAMKYLAVSEGTLLVYTMPIWATLFAWPILGTRPSLRDFVALLLGLSGLIVLLGAHGLGLGPDKLVGIVLALASAILFALGGVMTKSPLPIAPTALVAWQVGLGCLPMIVLGLLFEHPDLGAISSSGGTVLIYMVLGPMGVCYLTWFAALRRLPAATAAIGTLAVPIIGVIVAAIVLGEPLGIREALAMALTLAGVALALQKPKSPMPDVE
jgi:drug/metabolite transporter (DMT)-like permease